MAANHRRLVATLSCGCTRTYPAGVTAHRREHVLCLRHGPATTAATSWATTDPETLARRRRER